MRSGPRDSASAMAASTSCSEVASVRTYRTPSSFSSSPPRSSARSATTTFAPAACRRRTVASPSPPAPPTTRAALPAICMWFPLRATDTLDAREYHSHSVRRGSTSMPEAVIVSALRTPIGTAGKGTLRDTDGYRLAEHVVGAAVADLGDVPGPIDDVILGGGLYGGGVIARHAAVTAGLTAVPGLAINRHCAAGQGAVQTAAAGVRAGMDHLVIAGGVNSASTSPRFVRRQGGGPSGGGHEGDWVPWFPPTHPDRADAPNMDMSITVGWNAAVQAGVSRQEMDEWALGSHRKAIAAIVEGRFKNEIVPIDTPHGLFDTDEHPRRDTTLEKLAALKPLHPEIEGFSITAGNACGANDGAAVLTIASDRLGLPVLAVIKSWTSVGVDPAATGLAPVEAIDRKSVV